MEKCVDRLEVIGASACVAYDYCPKREACLAASRCLDARAGPPRRVGAGLVHIPLTEVPEDRAVEVIKRSGGMAVPERGHGAPDPVNHPSHYNSHPSGIECIEVVRHLNFNRGNAIKYIWRAGEKGGTASLVEDLKKARWYLDDEIKRLEGTDGKAEG